MKKPDQRSGLWFDHEVRQRSRWRLLQGSGVSPPTESVRLVLTFVGVSPGMVGEGVRLVLMPVGVSPTTWVRRLLDMVRKEAMVSGVCRLRTAFHRQRLDGG
jgi:hypothetical protein